MTPRWTNRQNLPDPGDRLLGGPSVGCGVSRLLDEQLGTGVAVEALEHVADVAFHPIGRDAESGEHAATARRGRRATSADRSADHQRVLRQGGESVESGGDIKPQL